MQEEIHCRTREAPNGTIKFTVPSRRGPTKLPVVYSQEEVNRIIQSVRSPKYRLVYMTAYGSGLRLTATQKRILADIHFCRTVGMGGHSSQCNACRHVQISYNSCRNRHCPKCQSLAKAKWLDARKKDLLPVRYRYRELPKM